MGSGGENGGGGKCDMRERYAREHGEKKIDARRREREENDEMVLWKIASTSGHKRRGRRRENEGRRRKREKEIEKPFSRTAKNSRDAVARPVHDRQIPVR